MPRKRQTTKRSKTQRGKGFKDIWRKVVSAAPAIHKFVKDNKLISRGLALTPYRGAAAAAAQLGYGTRRKKSTSGKRVRTVRKTVVSRRRVGTLARAVPRRRGVFLSQPVQMGTGIFSDIGSGLGSFAHGIFG